MRDVRQIVFSCTEYLDTSILPDAIVLTEEGEMKDWDLSPRGARVDEEACPAKA